MESPIQLHPDSPAKYCICTQGHLDYKWRDEMGGLVIVKEFNRGYSPTTLLIGWLADQAVLFGVLNLLDMLNLPVLSVECLAAKDLPEDD
jgi:hypothetical protein